VFVFAGEIGGIHPADEGMAAGNAILYLHTAANRATARDCGHSVSSRGERLGEKAGTIDCRSLRIEELAQQAQTVARNVYGWDEVVDQYEALFVGC